MTAASGRAGNGSNTNGGSGGGGLDKKMNPNSGGGGSVTSNSTSRPTSPNSIRANVSSPNANVGSGTALLDVARCYVGMARGNAMLKKYVHVLNIDPNALLHWKTKRAMH